MSVQPFLFGDGWTTVLDGNPTAEAIFKRHYSRRVGPRKKRGLIVGPGEKLVLLWPDARALFAWRKEQFRRDGQKGVECAIFRNEGAGLSSELIRRADAIAFAKWPGQRHFTMVNPKKVASHNPGYCFLMAGWRRCGVTKSGLLILERLPAAEMAVAA